ncbi:hypothetical protein Y032_0113g356 [Ancylostoma ceylanicum]|uniref:Mos1 transposase HTH domain-containing protein n=1 Tax=Ancylostoma ceylanicum TaxID=53326 RepID=A0A016TDK9_9BILA|nr:hypothetical protein Y032_0113g356 [Ancylostoma ceylanicum]
MAEEIVLDSNDAMGPSTVSYDAAKVWFRKFKNGDFDMTDKPRSGRPVGVSEERLLELIEEDPRHDTRELAEELQRHHNTVAVHLRSIGKKWRYGAWIPHDLSGRQLRVRRDACMNFLTFRRTFAWLEYLVTGDRVGEHNLKNNHRQFPQEEFKVMRGMRPKRSFQQCNFE